MGDSVEQTLTSTEAPLILTEAEFVRRYAGEHCEWVGGGGVVIPLTASSLTQNALIGQLYLIFRTYLELHPIAHVLNLPFTMRLETPERISRREPDIMIVLDTHRDRLHETYLDGPADLVVEVVSPERYARDHGEKVVEYEAGGVPEYWIIDPERRDVRFFRRNTETGKYVSVLVSETYRTPLLPGLQLRVADLWAAEFPDPLAIMNAVQAALKGETPLSPHGEGNRG